MIKIFVIIALIFNISCSSKIKPQDMQVALTLSERAYRYELEGKVKMSSFTYIRAIGKLRDMGEFCNMSRVAINMYTISDLQDSVMLEDARGFATLGSCKELQDIIAFYSNNTYNIKNMPEPYYSFAKGNYLSVAKSKDYSEHIRTHAYRFAAKQVLVKNPKKAIDYANAAMEIDSTRAWTKNLVLDYEIILAAMRAEGLPTDIIEERLIILRSAVLERF